MTIVSMTHITQTTGRLSNNFYCQQSVKQWMDSYTLKMNPSKTEAIMFCLRHHLIKLSIQSSGMVEDDIRLQTCIKYLGVCLDQTMSLHDNITIKDVPSSFFQPC